VTVIRQKNGVFKKIEEQLIVGRVLPPDPPLPPLEVCTRSSIGIRRPREEGSSAFWIGLAKRLFRT